MPELYPLLMKPHFDRRPWGARDLAPIYDVHVHPGEEAIGEAWLTGDKCEIANGPLAGTQLGDLCRRFGRDLVGTAAPETDRFPLLMKFLFPRDKLSVQVHPDDETARQQGEPCGKTECWYVVDAQEGAQIALGLKPGTTREEFEKSIRENRAEDLLNWINVAAGEMIFLDAGTVHTLGAGSIILETQQNSDTTYRLYDYGRPRELHLAKGLQAMKARTAAGKASPIRVDEVRKRLVVSRYFLVEHFAMDTPRRFQQDSSSPAVLVATEGCGTVQAQDSPPVSFARGDAVIIPASLPAFTVRPQWNVDFLMCSVPASAEVS